MSGNAVDYFIVVGPSSPFKPVTPHSHSAPSSAPARSFIDRTYAAELLFRYPVSDHAHLAFPPGISMFCMTDDLRLSSSHIMPKFYYFVATGSGGERLYGSCLKFYEELEDDRVRQLVAEDERLRCVREKEERERSELRRREVSVSLSKEEEREAELEEEQEREQAQKLMQLHNKIQEDQQRWKQHREQREKEKLQQKAADSSAEAAEDEEEEKEKGHRKQPLTIQLQPSPHSATAGVTSPQLISASSASSPVPGISSSNVSPDPPFRSRSSPVSAVCSPVTSSVPSPHLLQPSTSAGSSSGRPRKVFAPKCICTLSLHPFLSQCRSFLSELYRLSLVPSPLPLEHLIANFVNEIPLPPAGELKVQYSISNKLIFFFRPPPNNPLQATHFPLRLLFECLDSDNALHLIEAVLLEQRILLLSTKLSALTVVAETLLHLIFPFRWPHVYIPLLPRSLLDFLFAPMPFIIGMHHSYVKGHLDSDMMHDVIVVDLDANTVRHQAAGGKRLRQLPSRERKKLKAGLSLLHLYKDRARRSEYEKRMLESMDDAFQYAPSPDEIEQLQADMEREEAELNRYLELEARADKPPPSKKKGAGAAAPLAQAASSSLSSVLAGLPSPVHHEQFISSVFFRAFCSLLKDYRPFLIHPTASNPVPDPCFNRRGFLRHHDSSAHPFLHELLSTQAFTAFCEDRIFPCSAQAQQAILFFDQSILAKRNRSRLSRRQETPFLDDDRYAMRETYIVPPADTTGCKGDYRYSSWPQLDVKLFPIPRKIPAMYARRQNSISSTQQLTPKDSAAAAAANGGFSLPLSTTLEQVLYTVWFLLVCSIASEYGIHHVLNTAFKVLYDARLASVSLEEELFIRLMRACGACSIPDKAVEVLSIMQESGYAVTGQVYGQLLQVFSEGGGDGIEAMKRLSGGKRSGLLNHSPAASPHPSMSKGDDSEGAAEDEDEEEDDDDAEELSATSSTRSSASMQSPSNAEYQANRVLSPSSGDTEKLKAKLDASAAAGTAGGAAARAGGADSSSPKPNGSPRDENGDAEEEEDESPPDPAANAIDRPSPDDLTRFHRSFMTAFPLLTIDTTDRCPECRRELSDREIREGWTERNADYTTRCPKCGERFAAQFVVSVNPKASTAPPAAVGVGGGTEAEQHAYQRYLQAKQYLALTAQTSSSSSSERFPLTLAYLPPRVLKRELSRVIDEHSVSYIMHPSFRLHSTTLYWNLAWHLLCLCLPVHMLLWDMEDRAAVSSERMEMVHVMRSMSSEERGKRVEDRQRQRLQRIRRRRRLAGQRQAELSISSPNGAVLSPSPPSPSSRYANAVYSPTDAAGAAAGEAGGAVQDTRLATVNEKG